MSLTRREWLTGSAAVLTGLTVGERAGRASRPGDVRWKIGMCDWSMGRKDASSFAFAKEVGLEGVQVSIGWEKDNLQLRRPEVQRRYLETARQQGVPIASLAMGVLNLVPLHREPRAALWVADAIGVAKALGVRSILLPFFGQHDLKQDNETDMRRVIEALRELAPRAEKAGVILGLETYLSLEGHLKILDAVKSKAVQVYYDFYNSGATKGYDVVAEIKKLGRERICEVHFKEGPTMLGSGKVDWPAVVTALREIQYDGWVILETSAPSGDIAADTRKNLSYVKKLLVA